MMTRIVGIVNLSQDSFSGDGLLHPVKRAERLLRGGAEGVDVGAFSTRPGAPDVTVQEELRRLKDFLPDILRLCVSMNAFVSIDTFRASVAEYALDLGASMINDVTGGQDPEMFALLSRFPSVSYVLMHSLGAPADKTNVMPEHTDLERELLEWKGERLEMLAEAGVAKERVLFDPGVGFGKTAEQSWRLLRSVELFKRDEVPLYIGCSRKSFLHTQAYDSRPEERDVETLAVSSLLMAAGVDYLRVHDARGHVRAREIVRRFMAA